MPASHTASSPTLVGPRAVSLLSAGVLLTRPIAAGHCDEKGRSSKLAQTLGGGLALRQDNMLLCHSSVRARIWLCCWTGTFGLAS